jgi:hypothetical protein
MGAYDDRSVMNYCATPRLGGGVLSKEDAIEARKIYGDAPNRHRSLWRKAKKLAFHANTKINALWTLAGEKAKAALAEAKEHGQAMLNAIRNAFAKIKK